MMTTGRISTHHASRRKVLPNALTRRSTEDPAMGAPHVGNRLVTKCTFANSNFGQSPENSSRDSYILGRLMVLIRICWNRLKNTSNLTSQRDSRPPLLHVGVHQAQARCNPREPGCPVRPLRPAGPHQLSPRKEGIHERTHRHFV